MTEQLRDYRCLTCNKLLFKGNLVDSIVEIKCKGCKQINIFANKDGKDDFRSTGSTPSGQAVPVQ